MEESSETKTVESKKIVWGILIVGVLVAAAVIFMVYKPSSEVPANNKPGDTTSQEESKPTNVDPSQLPERFPAGMPLEEGAQVTQNYNLNKSGYFQSSRAFVTTKSVADNMKIYEKFFGTDGWTIIQKMDEQGVHTLVATKGDTRAHVDVVDNSNTGARTVEITVEYLSN